MQKKKKKKTRKGEKKREEDKREKFVLLLEIYSPSKRNGELQYSFPLKNGGHCGQA